MPKDNRNLLDVLKFELEFLEQGGTQQEIEEALGTWLRATIRRLEAKGDVTREGSGKPTRPATGHNERTSHSPVSASVGCGVRLGTFGNEPT
jgi:hypothetical protein